MLAFCLLYIKLKYRYFSIRIGLTGPNPRVLDIYTAIPNATELDTLINTFAGSVGPDAYAFIEFFGSDGAYYEKPLVGNIDIRDGISKLI